MNRKKLIEAAATIPKRQPRSWFTALSEVDATRAQEVKSFALEYINGGELRGLFTCMEDFRLAMLRAELIPPIHRRAWTDWLGRLKREQES